jgi:hypothetical protein
VLSECFALSRVKVAKVKHLAGPFYAVRYHSRRDSRKQYCVMVDVSTKYKGGGTISTARRQPAELDEVAIY